MLRQAVFLLCCFCLAVTAHGQTILGKSPNDKLLPGFFTNGGNADTLLDGINTNATHKLNGAKIGVGTVNSNTFDAATLSLIGTGGGGLSSNSPTIFTPIIPSPSIVNNETYTNSAGQNFRLGISTDGSLEITSPANNGTKGGRLGSNYMAGTFVYGNTSGTTNGSGSPAVFASDVTAATSTKLSTNFGSAQSLLLTGLNTNNGVTWGGNSVNTTNQGVTIETNVVNGTPAGGFATGLNRQNSFSTFGATGQEHLAWRLANFGMQWIDPNNALAPFMNQGIVAYGYTGDYSYEYQNTATYTYTQPLKGGGNEGAPVTVGVPFLGGDISGATGFPMYGGEIANGQDHALIGYQTDQGAAALPQHNKGYTNIVQCCKYLNTNGVVSALAAYGIKMWVWGDSIDGSIWETNRSASGGIVMETNLIAMNGATNAYDLVNQIHTNGFKLFLGMYSYSELPTQYGLSSDTARVIRFPDGSDFSYPSGIASPFLNGSPTLSYPYVPVCTPDSIGRDIEWFYTNRVDGITRQDNDEFSRMGYEQQVYDFVYNIIFPPTKLADHTFWKSIDTNWGGGNLSLGGVFPNNSRFTTNQLILISFVENPSTQTPFLVNGWVTDEGFNQVGNQLGQAIGMAYYRTYNSYCSNWPAGKCFPLFSDVGADLNSSSLTNLDYTNLLAIAEMCHGNVALQEDTNRWRINTNSLFFTNCPIYLSSWMDNTLRWPSTVYDDGTNSALVRRIDGGNVLVLLNNQSAAVSNVIINVSAPFVGTDTNIVYAVTNVYSGLFYGYMTNLLSNSVPASNCVYQRLSPVYGVNNVNAANLTGTQPLASVNSNVITNTDKNVRILGNLIQATNSIQIGQTVSGAVVTNSANDVISFVFANDMSDSITVKAAVFSASSFFNSGQFLDLTSWRLLPNQFRMGSNFVCYGYNAAEPGSGSPQAAFWQVQSIGGWLFSNSVVVPGTITTTNGLSSFASGTAVTIGTLGGTNNTSVLYRIEGFTGTSVVQTNLVTHAHFSRGTLTSPVDIILQVNDGLYGTSCAAIGTQAL